MKSLRDFQVYSYFDYGVAESQDSYYQTDEGLTFAFGMSAGSVGEFTKEELADYGAIVVYYETWNATDYSMNIIPTRPCALADFGLDKTYK